jgi:isoleucyl-tRNA synthetase
MSDNKNKKNPFQDTLNLPRTNFPIRANAATKEPEILALWQQSKLYEASLKQNEKNKKKFILHLGPPYANGHIHMGTAFTTILKDIVCKAKRLMGFYSPLIPGWDCHGLPIELKMMLENKIEKVGDSSAEKIEFKKQCRKYAAKWLDIQREEFKGLGIVADWDNPYKTMDFSYEADILRAFAGFVDRGYIERKNKTIPWCASCQTALAAAEMEYKERKDPSCYFLFSFSKETAREVFPFLCEERPELEFNLLVWTTTPWTIPLNRAVLIHPTAKYVILQGKEPNSAFVVAKQLGQKICDLMGIEYEELCEFDPPALQNVKARVQHPIVPSQEVPVILSNAVLLEEGTACVHSAPGCGPEDYILGVKEGLEIFSPLSADGRYTKEIVPEELKGMSIGDGQIWVIKKLAAEGRLLHKTSIRHSYPHCWRCRNGLMFRATEQWFCDLKNGGLTAKALAEIESIKFVPSWGNVRLKSFVQNRTEWCISRQKQWGVPIVAILCNKCDKPLLDPGFIKKVSDRVQQEGIEFWDKQTVQSLIVENLLPKDFNCQGCNNKDLETFRLERDILDVWFDSGVSHQAVLLKNKMLCMPADLYLEGSDQHRGWFQSSLLSSMILNGSTCTKAIMTHGFIIDENKRKMSKSLGNVIAPQDVIKRYSRDIFRLWVASCDFESDVPVSEAFLKNVSEVYRKIRNTCRFMLSNLYDFSLEKDGVNIEDMLKIDQYALSLLHDLNNSVLDFYQNYKFSAVVQAINNFCSNDLSALYLDVAKDRLYVEAANSHLRRSAQTTIYHIVHQITKLISPILSFTAEEISSSLNSDEARAEEDGIEINESIHLQICDEFPDIWQIVGKKLYKSNFAKSAYGLESSLGESSVPMLMKSCWMILEQIREVVLKAIEEQRRDGRIKHSLEAKIVVAFNKETDSYATLNYFIKEVSETENINRFFKDWFIVSQLEIAENIDGLAKTGLDYVFVSVQHADGEKCARCWQWDLASSGGKNSEDNFLCGRCLKVLS